jgi:hypothetical protein
MIWCHGESSGGTLGQLESDMERARQFAHRLDQVAILPIAWRFVEVQATESREAHTEAVSLLKEQQ